MVYDMKDTPDSWDKGSRDKGSWEKILKNEHKAFVVIYGQYREGECKLQL